MKEITAKYQPTEQEQKAFKNYRKKTTQTLSSRKEPEVSSIANDTGKHYRFQYTVALQPEDLEQKWVTINLDPFRIAAIYGITNFAQQTALKKILCAGNRGKKTILEDINDTITSLERWKQMLVEDASLECLLPL